jgi:DNA segregation ATPase FtsK/SpoIIIE and related proteins
MDNFSEQIGHSIYKHIYRGSEKEIPSAVWDTIEILWKSAPMKPFIFKKYLIEHPSQLNTYKELAKDGVDDLPKFKTLDIPALPEPVNPLKKKLSLPKEFNAAEIIRWIKHTPKKKQTWFLIINLPPGIDYIEFKSKEQHFATAVGGWCNIDRVGAAVYMTISNILLPRRIDYNFDPFDYPEMELPILFGYDTTGPIVLDLTKLISVLIAGLRDYGKSVLLDCIIYTLLRQNKNPARTKVKLAIASPKNGEFKHYENYGAYWAHFPEDIETLFLKVNQEYKRRVNLVSDKANNIQEYRSLGHDLPYVVVVADEIPMLGMHHDFFYRVLTQFRWMGIYIVGAAQRPSSTMWDKYKRNAWMDVKSQFECRCALRMSDATNVRMMFDSDKPANLPFKVPGRAILYWDGEHEIQTPYFPSKAKDPDLFYKLMDQLLPVPILYEDVKGEVYDYEPYYPKPRVQKGSTGTESSRTMRLLKQRTDPFA